MKPIELTELTLKSLAHNGIAEIYSETLELCGLGRLASGVTLKGFGYGSTNPEQLQEWVKTLGNNISVDFVQEQALIRIVRI